jgi:carbon monoxide dehydrogenase subunit G
MPEVVARTELSRPLNEVWGFVKDMDNWAPMLKGYVKHEQRTDKESIWSLSGDLGPFSKTVDFHVRVTEWLDAERVAFELAGVTEQVSGHGSLDIGGSQPPAIHRSLWQRIWDWLTGRSPEAVSGETSLTFTFSIQAGGPMGPMLNPMLGPYSEAVAKGLLASISDHFEGEQDD